MAQTFTPPETDIDRAASAAAKAAREFLGPEHGPADVIAALEAAVKSVKQDAWLNRPYAPPAPTKYDSVPMPDGGSKHPEGGLSTYAEHTDLSVLDT